MYTMNIGVKLMLCFGAQKTAVGDFIDPECHL